MYEDVHGSGSRLTYVLLLRIVTAEDSSPS